ncbi:MAG: tol-pal system protein YbgF [Litoreibacter sp.]
MMLRALYIGLTMCLCGPVFAQSAETLADIRRELTQLNVAVQSLKSELVSTDAQGGARVSGDVLSRVDGLEAAIVRLTSQTEGLENRINRIVADGTLRIGDLEFRLLELEGGDLSTLGQTPTLGGGEISTGGQGAVPSLDNGADGVELAVSERNDFERAEEALASGDFRGAADQFATFNQAYPGGPLASDAHFFQGEALAKLGDWNPAARSYLESFSGNPQSPRAPEALYKLGLSLHQLGQTSEGCLMLDEVGVRYPGSAQVSLATQSRAEIGCN